MAVEKKRKLERESSLERMDGEDLTGDSIRVAVVVVVRSRWDLRRRESRAAILFLGFSTEM